MVDSILREAKELHKEKENEVTWFKIFGVFEKLLKAVKSKEDVQHVMPQVLDLHMRSLQSDRTRLNGICLDFLKSCASIAQKEHNFNVFVPLLIRLAGKANKVFVTRAMDGLNTVCKYVDMKCIIRNVSEFIDSPNKNVRFAVFKIVEMRFGDAQDTLSPMVERGLKDPAQEVRGICKGIGILRVEKPVVEREIKKTVLTATTPRKSFKIDTTHTEIKKLETAVLKITKDQVVSKPISSDFFEKLSQLKRDRKPIVESKDYDLTPRRLDRYLNKYRAMSPVEVIPMPARAEYRPGDKGLAQSTPAVNTQVPDEASVDVDEEPLNVEAVVGVEMGTCNHSAGAVPEDQATFLRETLLFKNELGSSNCNEEVACAREHASVEDDASIIHRMVDATIHLEVGASDKTLGDVIDEYEGVADAIRHENEPSLTSEDITGEYNASIVADKVTDMSFCGGEYISELSHSFANMSIEPSMAMRETSPEIVRCSSVVVSHLANDMCCLELIDEYDMEDEKFERGVASEPVSKSQDESVGTEGTSIENNRSDGVKVFDGSVAPIIRPDEVAVAGESPVIDLNGGVLPVLDLNGDVLPVIDLNRDIPPTLDLQDIENNGNIPNSKYPDDATFVIGEEDADPEDIFDEIGALPSLGHFNDNIASFIEKLSQPLEVQDTIMPMTNINDTVIINVIQNHDLSDVFHQQTDIARHSCVELFNEPIFSSDEEDICLKKNLTLKERPSFIIEIPLDQRCDGSSANSSNQVSKGPEDGCFDV